VVNHFAGAAQQKYFRRAMFDHLLRKHFARAARDGCDTAVL
jgi:hypothetical protein